MGTMTDDSVPASLSNFSHNYNNMLKNYWMFEKRTKGWNESICVNKLSICHPCKWVIFALIKAWSPNSRLHFFKWVCKEFILPPASDNDKDIKQIPFIWMCLPCSVISWLPSKPSFLNHNSEPWKSKTACAIITTVKKQKRKRNLPSTFLLAVWTIKHCYLAVA